MVKKEAAKKSAPTKEQLKAKQQKLYGELSKKCKQIGTDTLVNEQRFKNFVESPQGNGSVKVNLYSASMDGNWAQVKSLLETGYHVDEPDEEGNTALIYACQNNHFKTAVILIANKANVNHASKFGFTPLIFASWKGHVDLVSLLLKHKADVKAVTAHKDTALHFAALCGFSLVCLLLRKAGAEMGVKNDKKKTPMDNMNTHQAEIEAAIHGKEARPVVDFQKSSHFIGLNKVTEEYVNHLKK